jgi:hypothetical protein
MLPVVTAVFQDGLMLVKGRSCEYAKCRPFISDVIRPLVLKLRKSRATGPTVQKSFS